MPPDPDFGDIDPEDEWDDGDAVALRLMLLGRILISIYDEALNGDGDRAQARRVALRPAAAALFVEATAELEA